VEEMHPSLMQTGLKIDRRTNGTPRDDIWRTMLTQDTIDCLDTILPQLTLTLANDEFNDGRLLHKPLDIFQEPYQMAAYEKLASDSTVETICETGFYIGRSAALYLCANPNAKVYSFDLAFPVPNVKALKSKFGEDRFTFFEGDSRDTLLEFANHFPFCDIMVQDGGRQDDVPWKDINNFARIASNQPHRKHTIILDEVYFYGVFVGGLVDENEVGMGEWLEKSLLLGMVNTTTGFCEEYCDHGFAMCDTPVERFPLVGDKSFRAMYPKGGYCAFSLDAGFVNKLNRILQKS